MQSIIHADEYGILRYNKCKIIKQVKSMVKRIAKFAACTFLLTLATVTLAFELPVVDKEISQNIQRSLTKLTKGGLLGPIRPTVVDGLYQVQIVGGPTVLISADGEHVIMGELYKVTDAGLAEVEDPYLATLRKDFIASLSPTETINFAPKGMTKAVAYVFTDIDCGYCRKLHSQMHSYNDMGTVKPGFNELGIEIRYLAYPRSGLTDKGTNTKTQSAVKLESAWCAEDKLQAMNDLKSGRPLTPLTCEAAPIARHYTKGGEIGINATPAILLPDGRMMLGYKSPAELLKVITQ